MIRSMHFLLLTTVSCLLCTSLFAQSINLHGGVLISNLRTVDNSSSLSSHLLQDYKSKIGVTFGASVDLFTGGKFSITPQVSYTQLGAKYNPVDRFIVVDPNDPVITALDVVETVRIQYLNFLVKVNYHLTDKIGVHFGPQISSQLSYKNSEKAGFQREVPTIHSIDLGLAAGAFLQLTDRLKPSINIYYGVTNVEEEYREITATDFIDWKSKNVFVSVELGYRIWGDK